MKKFLLKCSIFILIGFVLSLARPLYLLDKDRYKHSVAGNEIYDAIHKSKQKNESSAIIILGDSVANQLFNNNRYNGYIYSMACNMNIGMVGHFILLNNYLNAGNHVDIVCLIFSPLSLPYNLNNEYTYHYFLKPFYLDEYFPLLTETVIKQIHKIPYYQFSRYPNILTSNWAPDFASQDKINYTFLSPISVEYLVKIKELSIKHGFKVIVMPTPISLSNRRIIENMNKDEIVINGLDNEFRDYFKNIPYLDDSEFIDGYHLQYPLYIKCADNYIYKIYEMLHRFPVHVTHKK